MRQVRRGLFETNSSSTHSLTMCSGDEFRRWENGELLFDRWNEEFVEASSVKTGHNMDKVKETYEEVRGKLWKNFDDLTEAEIADFCEKYFEEDEETIYGRSSDLSAVFSRREKTKIIRIAKLINDVKHYTDSEQFIYELTALCSGRWNCGDNHYMNDSFHYPLYFVRRGLTVLWNELTTNGVLDNNKLEQVMFTEHEKRVNELGLRRVIEEDYQQDGPCHPAVYFPNKIGTAPVYVVDRHNREHCTGNELFVKSCGEGKGPNAFPNRYEFAIIRPIIEQEVEHGNYVKKDGYYIPTSDWRTKPIFHEWEGRIDIIGLREKRRFIQQIKEGTADRW